MTTLESQLGHSFARPELLEQALTHRSYHNENLNKSLANNERFEFLGDAVLDLALSDLLMEVYPESDEGELSKMRASLVNEARLAQFSVQLGIHNELRLGRGEAQSGGAMKPRLLASAFEAIVGAIFLDSNYEKAKTILAQLFARAVADCRTAYHFEEDYKTRLQERSQELMKITPIYEVLDSQGPDHAKTFHVAVKLGTQMLATGTGKSKKMAEQEAAKKALEVL
jgi:ribonuclease-3